MRPYYEENGIIIYHADCREVLPSLTRSDLLLTDPPYGIGESSKNHRSRGSRRVGKRAPHQSRPVPGSDYGSAQWDDHTVSSELVDWLIRMATHAVIWGGNYYPLAPSPCWLVWDKDNGSNDFADCELAWTNLSGAVRKFRWRWNGMIQEVQDKSRVDVRVHPTQKPLALMKWCLSLVSDSELILDPFMGSGTTLRAAKDLGRKAIGIEIEEKYCEITANRLRQEVLSFEVA